uniref:SCRp n=1 Tax=Arabidopsis halleri TaxID=81970 RepID=A0A0C5JYH2_ARAHA|nr:SCRp [Arabidopsis halleri]
MKFVTYILLCFIFTVLSHAQDVEVQKVKKLCNLDQHFDGTCGADGNKVCIDEIKSRNKFNTPNHCGCTNLGSSIFCQCKLPCKRQASTRNLVD